MAIKLRIPVDRLQIGMAVVELDRPWIETPFLLQGFTIGNRGDIKAIQEYCDYIYIDANSIATTFLYGIHSLKCIDGSVISDSYF